MKLLCMTDKFVYGASRHKKSWWSIPLSQRFLCFQAKGWLSRLRTANILLITLKALANEVAKNLVLAGIGSLTINDDQSVTEDDLCSQFFVSEEHVGMNVRYHGHQWCLQN